MVRSVTRLASALVGAVFLFGDLSARACPPPLLERLEPYELQAGDDLESIAARFALLPETLIRLNPNLEDSDRLPVGETILVPPFNGVRATIPTGVTWQDLAAAYGVRADTLFEINGCQPAPQEIFVPGVRWQSQDPARRPENYTGFAVAPLPGPQVVILAYGSEVADAFHSGLDLAAAPGTPALAVAAGTVVFAGEDETYGNLVAIEHQGDRQTRYAHLDRLDVRVGQEVVAGDRLGTTGTTGQPDVSQPHLHFEVRLNTPQGWVSQDPALHFAPGAFEQGR